MPFRWQINASAVSKLMGSFGKEQQLKAIAETWYMNLKRMPRFGVRPSMSPSAPTVEQVVEKELEAKPVYKTMVQSAVARKVDQRQVVVQLKRAASTTVVEAEKSASEAVRVAKKAKSVHVMRNFTKKKSGINATRLGGYFSTEHGAKIYQKTSRCRAVLSSSEAASADGWKSVEKAEKAVVQAEKAVVVAAATVKKAVLVSKHIERTSQKKINTTRGIVQELTDLEMVQKRYPNVVAGNVHAKFLHLRQEGGLYGAFVIGKIDGVDSATGKIYELKHRQSRLFHSVRRYEQVQCLLYLKMFRASRLTLVETYQGEQMYYNMQLRDSVLYYDPTGTSEQWVRGVEWKHIEQSLKYVVQMLNRAEVDESYRNTLQNVLF